MNKRLLLFAALILTAAQALAQQSNLNSENYHNKYEWRAAWISTVSNIDWPSKPGLDSESQKKELIEYLDLFDSLNFNAVVLQIRPTADAFYNSEYEPWSLFLTGDQELAPTPYYDPLKFAIEQAHKRGIELHAWLNPYRIVSDTSQLKELAKNHIYNLHPEYFVKHGSRCYFDPAFPESREFVTKVVADIVRRYDIDGIHFDDYFYPDNDFIDTLSFALHNRGYELEDKDAWRRENVDLLVEEISNTVKGLKPYVKFGISPFAVWRNKKEDPRGSDTHVYHYTNYDNLHADVLKWMENKWVDYILPQLYFSMGYEKLDFLIIKDWWRDNAYNTPLYAGLGSYRLAEDAPNESFRTNKEIANQIDTIRNTSGYNGFCFFTANNFRDNKLDINSVIVEKFKYPAIPPKILADNQKYSTATPPTNATTIITTNKDKSKKVELKWQPFNGTYMSVIYRAKRDEKPEIDNPQNIIDIIDGNSYICTDIDAAEYDYYITTLSRYAKESVPVLCKRQNIITKNIKKSK